MQWKGKWIVKGFKKTKDSIEAFSDTIQLGEKSTAEDVKQYYNKQYPYNVNIEILSSKKKMEVVV